MTKLFASIFNQSQSFVQFKKKKNSRHKEYFSSNKNCCYEIIIKTVTTSFITLYFYIYTGELTRANAWIAFIFIHDIK